MVKVHSIPPELVLNRDHSGLNLVPSGSYTLAEVGSKRVKMVGLEDKKQITATFLSLVVVNSYLSNCCTPERQRDATPGFRFHLRLMFGTAQIIGQMQNAQKRFITKVVVPYVSKTRQENKYPADKCALVIIDRFRGQEGADVLELLEENHILCVFVPEQCTDRLQPLDVAVNISVKEQHFRMWYSSEVQKQLDQGKQPEKVNVDMRFHDKCKVVDICV